MVCETTDIYKFETAFIMEVFECYNSKWAHGS